MSEGEPRVAPDPTPFGDRSVAGAAAGGAARPNGGAPAGGCAAGCFCSARIPSGPRITEEGDGDDEPPPRTCPLPSEPAAEAERSSLRRRDDVKEPSGAAAGEATGPSSSADGGLRCDGAPLCTAPPIAVRPALGAGGGIGRRVLPPSAATRCCAAAVAAASCAAAALAGLPPAGQRRTRPPGSGVAMVPRGRVPVAGDCAPGCSRPPDRLRLLASVELLLAPPLTPAAP